MHILVPFISTHKVDEMGINIVKYKLTNLEQSSMKQVKELMDILK